MRTSSSSIIVACTALGLIVAGATACGSRTGPVVDRPQSAREHLALAVKCEQEAAAHEHAAHVAAEGPETYVCDDGAFTSQTTSGTEPLTHWSPCWSYDQSRTAAHQQRAEELRAEARRHRASARKLIEVERTVCAPLSEDELSRTPFFHRDDIATAEPVRDGDRVIGATITFKPVPGLGAAWMKVAIACHQARAATLGYPATYMSYDPTLLEHARFDAADRDGRVVVTVTASDDVDAAVVWSRSAALCGPMPADE